MADSLFCSRVKSLSHPSYLGSRSRLLHSNALRPECDLRFLKNLTERENPLEFHSNRTNTADVKALADGAGWYRMQFASHWLLEKVFDLFFQLRSDSEVFKTQATPLKQTLPPQSHGCPENKPWPKSYLLSGAPVRGCSDDGHGQVRGVTILRE